MRGLVVSIIWTIIPYVTASCRNRLNTINKPMKPKNNTNKVIGGLIVLLIIIIAISYVFNTRNKNTSSQTTTIITATSTADQTTSTTSTSTMMQINPSAWQSVSSSTTGVTFSYPTAAQLNLNYIQTVNWPPSITVSNNSFTCDQAGTGSVVGSNGKTSIDIIGNNEYCVNIQSEGAAGSVYTTYAYTFPTDGKTLTLNFTLRSPQCENYPDPQMTACQTEESSFNVDQIANAMAQSIQYVRLISPAQPMSPASSTPVLNSISPISGPVGTTIVLRGNGFLSDNKVLFSGNVAAPDAQLTYFNTDGQSLTITVPSGIGPDCKANEACPMYERLVTPGIYTVTVENANGTSNALSFSVTQ